MTQKPKKEVDAALRQMFRVKRGDIPPFTGWKKPSTRQDLYIVMEDMGCFKNGVEVGVARGKNAHVMLNTIKGLNLVCVDPWTPYSNWGQHEMNKRYELTVRRLRPYIKTNQVHIGREESMDAVRKVKNGSLDFVYIDGFHDFDWVMPDLIFWAQKVRRHGIVAGHDYYPFFRAGVMFAVDAYTRAHNINDWYVTREKEPTWFWVKQ